LLPWCTDNNLRSSASAFPGPEASEDVLSEVGALFKALTVEGPVVPPNHLEDAGPRHQVDGFTRWPLMTTRIALDCGDHQQILIAGSFVIHRRLPSKSTILSSEIP
jgi:hypothetical protein